MSNAWTEDHFVGQPAIGLFAQLDREARGEVMREDRSRASWAHLQAMPIFAIRE